MDHKDIELQLTLDLVKQFNKVSETSILKTPDILIDSIISAKIISNVINTCQNIDLKKLQTLRDKIKSNNIDPHNLEEFVKTELNNLSNDVSIDELRNSII